MLTQEERQIIEYGKKNGRTAQEGLKALARYRSEHQTPGTQKQDVGFFSDLAGDVKDIGTGIKESVQRRGEKLGTILEADKRGEQGKASSIFQATTNFLGSVTDVAGQVIKGGVKAVLPQKAENKIKESISSVAQKVLNLPETQQFIKNYRDLEKESPEYARNVVALAEGGEFLLSFLGLKGAKDVAGAGIRTGKDAITTTAKTAGQVGARAVQAGERVLSKTGEAIESTGVTRIPGRVATNIAAKQAEEQAIKQLPSKVAQNAVRDGVELADAKLLIENATKSGNKNLMRELADTAISFARGTSRTNPIEVVGRPLVEALTKLRSVATTSGKKLGTIADSLGKVSETELKPAVLRGLQSVPGLSGLKIRPNGLLDFSGTTLATKMTSADRRAIQEVFAEAVKSGTGKSKHLLRQELFEVLGGKKGLVALTDTQDKAFQAVRKVLSDILDAKNAGYKAENMTFAKAMEPIRQLQKMMKSATGTDEDILEMSAGLLARRLTSNALSGPQLKSVLRSIDAVLGGSTKIEEVLRALQDLFNILDRYYPLSGGTSFKGQIEAAMQSSGLSEEVMKRLKALAGETPEVRQKALEKLLNELLGNSNPKQ